jgi:hypothetical protein
VAPPLRVAVGYRRARILPCAPAPDRASIPESDTASIVSKVRKKILALAGSYCAGARV